MESQQDTKEEKLASIKLKLMQMGLVIDPNGIQHSEIPKVDRTPKTSKLVLEKLISIWDSEANGLIENHYLDAKSSEIYAWKCKHRHSWRDPVSTVYYGVGCKQCLSFQYTHPDVFAWYVPEENSTIDISQIKSFSSLRLTWNCGNGHVFVESVRKMCIRKHPCQSCFEMNQLTSPLVKLNPNLSESPIDSFISKCESFEELPLDDLFLFKENDLYIKLEDINLSTRSYRALVRGSYSRTKEPLRLIDIVERSYRELYLLRNFGQQSQRELWIKLLEYMVEKEWN